MSVKEDSAVRIARAIIAVGQRERLDRPNFKFRLPELAAAIRPALALEFPKAASTRTEGGRDLLFDAICEACGADLCCLTREYAKQVATAKRDILEGTPLVTPDEVHRRAVAYRKQYQGAACTPMALANHWPEFGVAPAKRTAAPKAKPAAFSHDNPPDGKTWRYAVRYDIPAPPGTSLDELCSFEWPFIPRESQDVILAHLNKGRI